MGLTPKVDAKITLPEYDLSFVDANGDGKIDLNNEVRTQDGTVAITKNDPNLKELKGEFKRLGLIDQKPVPFQTLEGYIARLRASQTKTPVETFANGIKYYTNEGNFEKLSQCVDRLTHDQNRGLLDKNGDNQSLRVSLINAREKIILTALETKNPSEQRKLVSIGGRIESLLDYLNPHAQWPHAYDQRLITLQKHLNPATPIALPQDE